MIKLLITGDFCPQDRVAKLIEKEDYKTVFGEVLEFTENVDYSIVNLEAPVVETNVKPIEKCGPNLKCTSKAIKALKYAGFDMVTLANNHFYDYGDNGVKQTLAACKKEKIDVVGGGINIFDASKTFYKEIKGLKLAIINCCEHEFSIATEISAGSNPLNPIQQYYAIREAKQKADKVIVIVHGGHEHYQLPSPRMKETYRFFIDAGADAVINHHQHCYSGNEVYNGKPIFYGLGNLCFDWPQYRNCIWNEGYVVILNVDKEDLSFDIIPYKQGNNTPAVSFLKVVDKNMFERQIIELNKIIANPSLLKSKHEEMMAKYSKNYSLLLQPYMFRLGKGLYTHGFAPSLVGKRKIMSLLNYFMCESHLERFIYALKTMK